MTKKTGIFNYFRQSLFYDLKAGFITSIVALPLAIAFAIASGVEPIYGLYTAIIAGIIGSILGGSRFSITGPTGAMTVIILAVVAKYGFTGLMLTGLLAGIIQVIFGIAKLGKIVKYIPLPVVSGFTAGIGLLIFIGQIPSLLGIIIPAKENTLEIIPEVIRNITNFSTPALVIGIMTIILLMVIPKLAHDIPFLKNIPASLYALLIATGLVMYFKLAIPLVGNIPHAIPAFQIPIITFDLIKQVLPSAFTIALLGSIEALLCAVVADGMTNTKHNSNKELVSQGCANIVLPFFGGIPATAAIARTAVNIRENAKTRMAGVYHAVFLVIIVIFFAQYAQNIPKAFLAGILMYVSVRMINIQEIKNVFKISTLEGSVLLITMALTIATDLVFAVQVGMVLAIVLLFVSLSQHLAITHISEYDDAEGIRQYLSKNTKTNKLVGIYTIHGPFFFGAISVFEHKIAEHIDIRKPFIILRMKHVPFIDSSGITHLIQFVKSRSKANSQVLLTSLTPEVATKIFEDKEITELIPKKHIFETTKQAIEFIEEIVQGMENEEKEEERIKSDEKWEKITEDSN